MSDPGQRARDPDRPVVLGIAGGTSSGKTTVARAILEAVGQERIAHLQVDSYYRDIAWDAVKTPEVHNFDHPSALDLGLLAEHLRELRGGGSVDVPVYDFVNHRRTEETRRVDARTVVMVEGILLFVDPELRDLLDFRVFVDADSDVRLIRRIMRDLEERGRSLTGVLDQYLDTVRPMHLEFVEPSKRWADVIVPVGGKNQVALEMVVARVEQLLARGSG